ncbi:MAG: hypothetical protein AAFX01_05080 [Cyanobacteria bacterium J06638_28]
MGIAIFVFAVSIDSFQHQASAAEIQRQDDGILSLTVKAQLGETATNTHEQDTYLTFNTETAERLRHSALTSANLTRCRLTTAHFFNQASGE